MNRARRPAESFRRPARFGRHKAAIASLPAAFILLAMLFAVTPTVDAVVLPEADLRVSGSVQERPEPGGIDTGSTMRYEITVRNDGPTTIPVGSLLLVLFVDRSDASELATIEVARFNDNGGLRPANGGDCGNGRRVLVQCTNRRALEAGEEIRLDIGHRHPAPEAGTLSFVAEASLTLRAINDPVAGNNTYRGPNYQFRSQPSTTTTSSTTSTTMETTTTSEETTTTSGSSSTTDPNASSTTMESTTSSSSTTTSSTTSSSSTTTPSTTSTSSTTTTVPATTTSTTDTSSTVTETSLAALAGSATLPGGPTTVLTATETSNDQLVLGQSSTAPSGGGPPYLAIFALFALVLVLGGVATAVYVHLNKPPPLVDMRRFD